MHACDHKAWFCECHHFLMTIPMGYCCALRPLRPLASIYLWLIGTKSCPSNKGRVHWHINKGFQCEIWCLGLLCDKNSQNHHFLDVFNTIFCHCGTIFRGDPVFYGANWSPLHKESIHRSHVHQGCMPAIISSGFASVATFRGLSPWDYFVLSGPWPGASWLHITVIEWPGQAIY